MGLRKSIRRFLEKYRSKRSLLRSGLPASVFKAMEFVSKKKLSFLGFQPLSEIAVGIHEIEKQNIPGIFIETGCALGGSTILIASAKAPGRMLFVYDTFELIPPPSDDDGQDVHDRYKVIKSGRAKGHGRGETYYGYVQDRQAIVANNFEAAGYPVEQNSTTLIKGLFQDTLRVSQPVAFAHIDCDWHDSVKTCLERIAPCLSPGGLLIIDDYYNISGCRKAVDRFLEDNGDMFIITHKSRLHLQKKIAGIEGEITTSGVC